MIEVGNPNLTEATGPCGKKGALYRVLEDGVPTDGVPEDESVNGQAVSAPEQQELRSRISVPEFTVHPPRWPIQLTSVGLTALLTGEEMAKST